MLKSTEIMDKYNLTSEDVEKIIRYKKISWGLVADSDGSYSFSDEAVKKLETLLEQHRKQATVGCKSGCACEAKASNNNEKLAHTFAASLSEHLDLFKAQLQESYKKDLAHLKNEICALKASTQKQNEGILFLIDQIGKIKLDKLEEFTDNLESFNNFTEFSKELKNAKNFFGENHREIINRLTVMVENRDKLIAEQNQNISFLSQRSERRVPATTRLGKFMKAIFYNPFFFQERRNS
ncbi:hypothetical protein ACFL35_07230 [Candidatus Riflebacteria bacterium]